jgi:hypothetical protein
VFAPIIAGAVLGPLNIWMARNLPNVAAQASGDAGQVALLALDLISAAFAISTLLVVRIPQPEPSESSKQAEGGFLEQALFGFKYILSRPSLLGLQLVFLVGNFFSALGWSVRDPMILARTNSDQLLFGSIQTVGAIGGIVGGLVIGAWGGFKRRVHGVLLGWALGGLAMAAFGAARTLTPWLVASFAAMAFVPLVNSSNQAIWQAKVAPDIQGRVFATRRLIAWLISPISQLIAGPLADYVFEPLFSQGSGQATIANLVFGSGPGTGMGVQVALAGLAAAAVGLSSYLFPAVRNAETRIADFDATEAVPAPSE